MSYMNPVWAIVVDCQRLSERVPNQEEAFALLPEEYLESEGYVIPAGMWQSTSHNWWYLSVVERACVAYPGHDEVRYLCKTIAIIQPSELQSRSDAIHRLLAAIQADPAPFVAGNSWWGIKADEVTAAIKEAVISRDVDDQTREVDGGFFSYLVSQAAALDEAISQGKCLLHFQLH